MSIHCKRARVKNFRYCFYAIRFVRVPPARSSERSHDRLFIINVLRGRITPLTRNRELDDSSTRVLLRRTLRACAKINDVITLTGARARIEPCTRYWGLLTR